MKVIICLDNNNGISFNNRRQSRDRVLIDDVMKSVNGGRLFVHPYSEILFTDKSQLVVSGSYLQEAGPDDYCFVELQSLDAILSEINEFIVYHWNRHYPADSFFTIDLAKQGFKLDSRLEFEGSSHDKITKEVYKK